MTYISAGTSLWLVTLNSTLALYEPEFPKTSREFATISEEISKALPIFKVIF